MMDSDKIEGFDWDAGNARKNEKHGVIQSEAEQIFFNQPLLIIEDTQHSRNEMRYQVLGKTDFGRLLHVTFTLRAHSTKIRVISARVMSVKERRLYETETDSKI
jgi:uncharacterized DUF497 family protein